MSLFRSWVLIESEDPSSSLLSLKLIEMELEVAASKTEFEIQLGEGEAGKKDKKPYALVKLHAAAMNHRDLWIRKKLYPGIKFGSILGADGAGTVVRVSNPSHSSLLQTSVIINSSFGWGSDPSAPSLQNFGILGLKPLPGTFATYISVPIEQLYPKPSFLSFPEASAIPLAGLTAWRATVTKAEVKKGSKVLVTGVGGGVALFALQFAIALGAEVYVTSSSPSKIVKAKALGAIGGVNYTKDDWAKELVKLAKGRLDAVVDGAGGASMNEYLKVLRPGGIISHYGATAGLCSDLSLHALFLKQIELRGSTMGSDKEFEAMMKLINETHLQPVIDSEGLVPFHNIELAFERMEKNSQFGKIVIDISSSGSLSSKL